ncbi:MAG: YsnF/AvaK domain-containing protein [Bacteroidota bacterium]|nr:YsnF/AvaK domain-containing protein [Bacteroidota bacterium]
MGQTVIGVFEDSSSARKAVEQLTSSGISRSSIDISENDKNQSSTTDAGTHEEDSISRFFNNLFGNNDQSKYYSEVTRGSSSLVTVHAQSNDEAQRAVSVLDEYGAIDIDERAADYGYNRNAESNFENRDMSFSSDNDESKSIPVIEEELHVGKREVETGGARIKSRIVEKPVEETLRLRHEHVNVERNPVNRPASESDLDHFQEGEINVTEHAEVPVVNKEARVVEEVKINKEVGERQETVRENVRKTEVDVETFDENDKRSRYDESDRLNKSDENDRFNRSDDSGTFNRSDDGYLDTDKGL